MSRCLAAAIMNPLFTGVFFVFASCFFFRELVIGIYFVHHKIVLAAKQHILVYCRGGE